MREGVITNLVTFIYYSSQQIWIGLSILASYKKRGGRVLFTQYVEDGGSPPGIWTIIKRQRNHPRFVTCTLYHVRRWCPGDLFVLDKAICGINLDGSRAVLRSRYHCQQFAIAFEVNLVSVIDLP